MKFKNRILITLFSFLLLFNLIFSNVKDTYALIGVDDAIIYGIVSAIVSYGVSSTIELGVEGIPDSLVSDIAQDFVDNYMSADEKRKMVTYYGQEYVSKYGYDGNSSVPLSPVASSPVSGGIMSDILNFLHDYLIDNGYVTDEGFSYRDSISGDYDYESGSTAEVFSNWVLPIYNNVIGNSPDYTSTFFTKTFPKEYLVNYPYCTVGHSLVGKDDAFFIVCCSENFLDINESIVDSVTLNEGHVFRVMNIGTNYYRLKIPDGFTTLGNFFYGINDGVVYGPYATDKTQFWVAPDKYIEFEVTPATSVQTTHNADGTVTTDTVTYVNYYYDTTTNDDGTVVYNNTATYVTDDGREVVVPVPQAITKPGVVDKMSDVLTRPDVIGKDVITTPAADAATGKVTGAVSVTNLGVVTNAISNAATAVSTAVNSVSASIADVLTYTFVPDLSPITEQFDVLKTKFAFFEQLKSLYRRFVEKCGGDFQGTVLWSPEDAPVVPYDDNNDDVVTAYDTASYDFDFTLPTWLGGSTCTLIDFELFLKYREFLHNAICFFAYIMWSRKMLHRLPTMFGKPV